MQSLTLMLTRMVPYRPVLDRTGLKGRYDFTLAWEPESARAAATAPADPAGEVERAASSEFSGPSIFTALQKQLGFEARAHKRPG